ncbi:hypothetical protein LTR37_018073 [Vermiconidia calcicola]|uniref:Uncharacterized protein n=1 Tax=Vermiconidia calcicola TaxID=1690605 RepID=A0ACC3MI65_9PEZI|nr:hypothetical protein LTR37_018073 [Vermiconidia calcicola]
METRSTRRTARRKYTVDAFEGVDELRDAMSDDEAASSQVEDDGSEAAPEPDAEHVTDEDHEMSGVEAVQADEDVSDRASDAGEQLLDDTVSIAGDPDDVSTNSPKTKRNKRKREQYGAAREAELSGAKAYTRGLVEHEVSAASKETRRLLRFGPSEEDFEPVGAARNKWAYEATLPSRIEDGSGFGGMHHSFFLDDDAWAKAAEKESKWWVKEGGKMAFLENQILETMDLESADEYLPERGAREVSFLMGPYKSQRLHHLPVGAVTPLEDAWSSDVEADGDMNAAKPCNYKSGFVLDLGARVQCLDWCPNQSGDSQYLAVSVLPQRDTAHAPYEAPAAPAFAPQPLQKSNVQIWRFTRDNGGGISTAVRPELEVALCTSWSDAKELKWCPMPWKDAASFDGDFLGLLAGTWADGSIRVLHISSGSQNTGGRYIYVKRAAFESRPPNTVCTCLAWVSSSRIAAGCANGCVAIWDLPGAVRKTSSNPRPIIYSALTTSYVLSICTCYPSRPNILLATSMAGYITMTDLSRSGQSLSSPATAVYSQRIRLSQKFLAWHDFAQSVLNVEDNFVLYGRVLRRIFTSIGLGKAKSNATSLAVSPCHPFVLVGTASGEVWATNPLNRVFDARRSGISQQTWFTHEWRSPTVEEAATANATSDADGRVDRETHGRDSEQHRVGPDGVSRISEGFKVEQVALNIDDPKTYNSHGGAVFATVYEEKSAITALAWNPNPHVGGWAAAGMGDGLLRVEDIAI